MVSFSLVLRSACVAAAMALAASGAHALTVTGDFQADADLDGVPSDATIYDDTTTALSPGDVFTTDVFASSSGEGAGALAFAFTANVGLLAVDTSSLNPVGGFTGLVLAWTTGIDGSGVLASRTGAQLQAGAELVTSFVTGQTKFLYLTWDSASANANFDMRVEAIVPLPAALPLFLTAMGGLGFLGWRRKKHS